MRNYKKLLIVTSIFLLIFVLGTILIFLTPFSIKSSYGHTIKTSDGETISFNVFEPRKAGTNKKAVIIGHGVMSNKEMMKGFAIELAAAGFIAIPFDFRGHGQSTGELDRDYLIEDVRAIISYVNSRSDIDPTSLGYLGYSMGGFPGIEIVNESANFKCFIGAGTNLPTDVRKGNSSAPLNVLMIVGKYDEVISLTELKEGLADRTGISISDLDVNQLYGSFENGNASKIYLDDNTNHVLGIFDADFIREARDFVANTFSDVKAVDENFYANIRFLILILQIFGGLGFFFSIIALIPDKILRQKEDDAFKIEIPDETIKSISKKTILYSIPLGILGIIIFIPLILTLFLPVATFLFALLFGQAFGILILLWRFAKRTNQKLSKMFKKPFQMPRNKLLINFTLGILLAVVLYLILYSSVGLNYLGMMPSLIRIAWLPIYFIMDFIILLIFGLLFHGILQNKFERGFKNIVKISLIIFAFLFSYLFVYLFIIALLMGNFFFFGSFMPFAIPIFLLVSFISTVSYQKTGNIIVGILINTLFYTMLICTISTYQPGLSFILGFAN
jgi:alpha/beta superfamily hydrolase